MDSLFLDGSVHPDLLKKHVRTRWAVLPDGVISLTAADPGFQVAVEIREAIMEVELLRLGERPHL